MLIVGTVLGRARMGRELYAIGSNPDAATLAGIRTTRRVLGAFVASGAIAGLAGVLYAARYGTLDAAAGNGIELAAVSAVVVGGVAIFGGSGTVYGAALGALLLGTIRSALVILQVNPFWEQAINGALLLLAIGLDAFLATRLARELRKRASHRV
jgi:rhamnose transport system permease protein